MVPYNELLKRILNDLELFKDTIIIRFVKFSNDNHWKVFEFFMSESIRYDKSYYIPTSNFNVGRKFTERFPSCDIGLSTFLDDRYSELDFHDEHSLTDFDINILSTKPIKHFSKKLTINTSFTISKSYSYQFKTKYLNMLIQLMQ